MDGRSLLAPGRSPLDGDHWRALKKLLPAYRELTRVRVGNGKTTSFWHDWWLPCGPLGVAFPALFTHTICPEATVWRARQDGVRALLVPRLTPVAIRDCAAVHELMVGCVGAEGPDARLVPLCPAPKGAFSARAAYGLARLGGVEVPAADFLWSSPAPSRVKFFSGSSPWLGSILGTSSCGKPSSRRRKQDAPVALLCWKRLIISSSGAHSRCVSGRAWGYRRPVPRSLPCICWTPLPRWARPRRLPLSFFAAGASGRGGTTLFLGVARRPLRLRSNAAGTTRSSGALGSGVISIPTWMSG